MARIRYSIEERHKILVSVDKLYPECSQHSLKAIFEAAMRDALKEDRWRDLEKVPFATFCNAPSYAWFREGVTRIALIHKNRKSMNSTQEIIPEQLLPTTPMSTPSMIAELFNRLSISYESIKDIPSIVLSLNERITILEQHLGEIETSAAKLAHMIYRMADELGVSETPKTIPSQEVEVISTSAVEAPKEVSPPLPPVVVLPLKQKPRPLHIKVIGPLADQQRIISNKTSDMNVALSFIASDVTVAHDDFNGCDRCIITRHVGHVAYHAACNTLGRSKVVRINSGGLGTIVKTISNMANQVRT